MIKQYCDVCGHDTVEHSMEDLLGSRTISVKWEDANGINDIKMTFCCDCKEKLLFLLTNEPILFNKISELSFSNRLRALFKKPIKPLRPEVHT